MSKKNIGSEYKPRGRIAHSGHVSRVGQAWKEKTVQVFAQDSVTGRYNLFNVTDGLFECPKCGYVVEYDSRGYAFCDCHIWNDAKPRPLSDIAKQVRCDIMTRKTKHFARSLVSI